MMKFVDKGKGYYLDDNGIAKVETAHNAIFMGYWAIQDRSGNWSETPVDVFYQPDPDVQKGHSHYFGIYRSYSANTWMICNAETAFCDPLYGVCCDTGEVIISRFRHDYVTRGNYMVDGGRDYLRSSQHPAVIVKVEGSNFVVE